MLHKKREIRDVGIRVIFSLIVAILLFLLLVNSIKLVFGIEHPFMVVVSNSMYPTLKINDLIIVKEVDPSTLTVGDIIVFRSPLNPDDRIVHRIYEIINYDPPAFRTKGDNNKYPDRWIVTDSMVIGKVIMVLPYIGIIPRILQPPINYILIILIVIIIFIIEVQKEVKKNEMVPNLP